jgi:hypothetical protein
MLQNHHLAVVASGLVGQDQWFGEGDAGDVLFTTCQQSEW